MATLTNSDNLVITCDLNSYPAHRIAQEFDDKPLGTASIAQVHRAVLKDGRQASLHSLSLLFFSSILPSPPLPPLPPSLSFSLSLSLRDPLQHVATHTHTHAHAHTRRLCGFLLGGLARPILIIITIIIISITIIIIIIFTTHCS